jgi:Protein of unknown function (DUF2917)
MHAFYALERRNTMPFDRARTEYVRTTHLPQRSALVLDGAAGTIVSVEHGCVWITLERDPRDVVLTTGMRFEIDRDGRTVVVAEEDTRLRLTRPLSRSERITANLVERLRKAARRFWGRQAYRLAHQKVPYC